MSKVIGKDINDEDIEEYMLLEPSKREDKSYGLLFAVTDDNGNGYAISLLDPERMIIKPIKDMVSYAIFKTKAGVGLYLPARFPDKVCSKIEEDFRNGMRSGQYHKYVETDISTLSDTISLTRYWTIKGITFDEKADNLFRQIGESLDPVEFNYIKDEYEIDEKTTKDINKTIGEYKYHSSCIKKAVK